MDKPSSAEKVSSSQLIADTLQKLPTAGYQIVRAYTKTCAKYGMDPGIVRLFAAGSLVKDGGKNFGENSDVDLVFSVEHPDRSLSATPSDAITRSEAENERELRNAKMLQALETIWTQHSIIPPLNIPHGETSAEVWGLPLLASEDFSPDRPGVLLAELNPAEDK